MYACFSPEHSVTTSWIKKYDVSLRTLGYQILLKSMNYISKQVNSGKGA